MYKNGPDEDWEQRVAVHIGEGVYLEPKTAFGYAHPRPHLTVAVSFHNDRLWIKHSDLTEGGYDNLEAGSIVWVNDRFYELQSRSHVSRRPDYEWWVEEIVTEGAADDITPQMFTVWKPDEND